MCACVRVCLWVCMCVCHCVCVRMCLSVCPASDPGLSGGGGGARNMKYKARRMAAIFFMTSFNRDIGRHGPWPPFGSAAAVCIQ